MASVAGAAAGAAKAFAMLLAAPLVLALVAVVYAIWAVATLTAIGPLLHYLCSRADKRLLDSIIEPAPGAQVRMVPVSGGRHRLAVRWTPGDGSRPYPVRQRAAVGGALVMHLLPPCASRRAAVGRSRSGMRMCMELTLLRNTHACAGLHPQRPGRHAHHHLKPP